MIRALFRSVLAAAAVSAAVVPAAVLPAAAQSVSAEIATQGLAATEARLAALPEPTPAESFGLGGVRFLRAIERTLQLRWQTGMNAEYTELPVLRLPIPPNPAPKAFTPDLVTRLFQDMRADLDGARAALDPIGEADFELKIRLGDLWFDIDMDGKRSPGEGVIDIASGALTGGRPIARDPAAVPFAEAVVLFDTADAAWLSAYTHFLSGFAALVLAFDPEAPIAEVVAAHGRIMELQANAPPPNALDYMFGRQVDRLMMVYRALRQQPDADLTRTARAHFLAMVADNRRFWRLVEAETDSLHQWVPNSRQTSALGLSLPEGTGERWQAVLADAEAVLEGRKLVPHWRFGAAAGINAAKWFDNPGPVEIAEWAHGMGLLPWAEAGERVSADSWLDFERLMRGDAVLFAVFLN